MKNVFFAFVFAFCAVNFVSAQSAETPSELKPVPSYIGKFSTKPPRSKSYQAGVSDFGISSYKPRTNLKFDVKIEPVKLSDGKNAVAVVIRTNYPEMLFANRSETAASLKIYGRITSNDDVTDGFFEENISVSASEADLLNSANKFSTFRKVFELPAGNYQFGVIVTDLEAENRGAKIVKFQIPATENK